MKSDTRSLIYIARKMREFWPKGRACSWTRQDIAHEVRSYLRHNDHLSVRRAYQRGDALHGYM